MYGQHTRLENEILNKILSYHFLVESYTFFCIFCRARPRVSDCVFHAIPTQRHATVTVGPGDEAGIDSIKKFSVYSYSNPDHPNSVTVEENGKINCTCAMFSSSPNICAHSVAVAQKENNLPQFLRCAETSTDVNLFRYTL